jgi:uncharacterized protein YbjT (DUF2867 family)
MKKILVVGASGFVGGRLARGLLAEGYDVRCLVRNPAKVGDLARAGCEIVPGDMTDPESVQRALASVDAVYISVHTLTTQHASTAGQGFMDIEMNGLKNIVAACKAHGTRRLIYVTSLGIEPGGPSAWTRERWKTEQFLLHSGLDATAIRPGQIVGIGGQGFNMTVAQAKRSTAFVIGNGRTKFRNIALDDLVCYLVGVLNDPRAYGQAYDVGCDDVLTHNQMIDVVAAVLGRRPPRKIHIPLSMLRLLAPLIQRIGKFPKGALAGLLDGMGTDLVGDPMPIRAILPRPLLSYRDAVARALTSEKRG